MSDYIPSHMRNDASFDYPLANEDKDLQQMSLVDYVVMIVSALAIALFLRSFVFEPYVVPTGSMLETIQLGDRLIGEKISYRFRSPQTGEIVTFVSTNANGDSEILVKRVIATEGQTIDLIDGRVYVDGYALDEPYTLGKPTYALSGDISYPYTVSEGYIWVMGDNRTNSSDSRYFGPVALEDVTSHVVLTYWPFEHFEVM